MSATVAEAVNLMAIAVASLSVSRPNLTEREGRLLSDLFAIVAGCRAGERAVIGLCERFGKATYLAALQADRTAALAFLVRMDGAGPEARRRRREGTHGFAALLIERGETARARDNIGQILSLIDRMATISAGLCEPRSTTSACAPRSRM